MNYKEVKSISLEGYTKEKGDKVKLTYLSWAWAVDKILELDPAANWTFSDPTYYADGSVMVYCSVTAFEKTMTAFLPVLDHRNQPIFGPNAMQINTAMQRCLVKAIALHGLGLYLYQGEDYPENDGQDHIDAMNDAETPEELAGAFGLAWKAIKNPRSRESIRGVYELNKKRLEKGTKNEATQPV